MPLTIKWKSSELADVPVPDDAKSFLIELGLTHGMDLLFQLQRHPWECQDELRIREFCGAGLFILSSGVVIHRQRKSEGTGDAFVNDRIDSFSQFVSLYEDLFFDEEADDAENVDYILATIRTMKEGMRAIEPGAVERGFWKENIEDAERGVDR